MIALGHGSITMPIDGQPVEDHEQLHEQRRAADHRDVEPRDAREHAVLREPQQRDAEREHEPDRERGQRERDRAAQPAPDERPERFEEQLPAGCHGDTPFVKTGASRPTRETSAPKYFSPISASTPSSRSSASAASIAATRAALSFVNANALSDGSSVSAAISRPRLAVGLHVVEEGQLVVDGRVDAALLEQRDGLGPALDGLDVRARLLGELVPVARERLRGGLAGEVVEARDRRRRPPSPRSRRARRCTAR